MKLYIKSTHNPALLRSGPNSYRIVAGTITEVNGKKWDHPFVAVKGNISLNDIEWVRPTLPAPMKVEKKQVKGSTGKTYTIIRQPNGKWTCDCPGFQYRRFCKHTGAK